MALFNFEKNKPAAPPCACACGMTPPASGKRADECRVKILGAGCRSCQTLYENAMDAAEKLSLCHEVAYITDMPTVAAYGVTALPALVIDETVVSMGRILKPAEIEKLLRAAQF